MLCDIAQKEDGYMYLRVDGMTEVKGVELPSFLSSGCTERCVIVSNLS